jgi:hypothetical protein
MLRKFFKFILVLILIPVVYAGALYFARADLDTLPPLESGDLIFQTFINNQSLPIIVATGSLVTHVGMVHKQQDGSYTVIHAASHVIEVPLAEFVRYGWGQRFTVLRYPGLNDTQRAAIIKDAESYLGRSYNYVFYMKAQELYCSELPYLAFKSSNLSVGNVEKIGDLNMNNRVVENLFKERWQMHPACNQAGMDYQSCWKEVLSEPIITPISIRNDQHLLTIYNNYLF